MAVKGLLAGARPRLRLFNVGLNIRHGGNQTCPHITAIAAAQMPVARQNLGEQPRAVRKAKPKIVLDDEAEARLRMTEAEYRRELFRSFVKFARECNAWVVSPPFERRCRVLVPDGSPLLERLAQLPRYPVVKLPGTVQRLQSGRFIGVSQVEVCLWP